LDAQTTFWPHYQRSVLFVPTLPLVLVLTIYDELVICVNIISKLTSP